MESCEYNVALRYTKAAGGYEGVITWTSFKSKEDFDSWFKEGSHDQEVVEEGISQERAVELARQTLPQSYIRAALEDCIDPRTGELIPELIEHATSKAAFNLVNKGLRD